MIKTHEQFKQLAMDSAKIYCNLDDIWVINKLDLGKQKK